MNMIEKPECWSVDNEYFNAESLGDLIDGNDNLEVGQMVYVADALIPDPGSYVDVDSVLEQMGERAFDDCGEAADVYPDVTGEAKQELDDILKAWARQHCTPRFWEVRNVREYILTEEDIPQDAEEKATGAAS